MRPWKESIPLTTASLVMQLTQTMPVYAGQIDNRSLKNKSVSTEEVILEPKGSGASRDSVLTGSIRMELISMGLPTGGVEFQVNTDIPFHADNPGARIQEPDIHVANHFVVPVKLEISQVADVRGGDMVSSPQFSKQVEQTFRLVDKVSGTGPPGSAVLVLGVAGTRYDGKQELERYAIVPGRQNIFITDIPVGESWELNLYGKVTPDFYGEYQFTVHPTLRISTVQAEPAD